MWYHPGIAILVGWVKLLGMNLHRRKHLAWEGEKAARMRREFGVVTYKHPGGVECVWVFKPNLLRHAVRKDVLATTTRWALSKFISVEQNTYHTVTIHLPEVTGAIKLLMLQFCESSAVPKSLESRLLNQVKRSATLSSQILADEGLEGCVGEKLEVVVASDGGGI